MTPAKSTVMVLCPTPKDIHYASRIDGISEEEKERFTFHKVTASKDEHLDLLEYTKMCEKVVVDKNIQHILSLMDAGALVHAALAQKFPHIIGPSMESVLLAFHKYYTRMYLDLEETTLKHVIIDADDTSEEDMQKAIAKVGVPAFLKPCTGTESFGVRKISSISDLKEHITWYNTQNHVTQISARFVDKYANKDLYPYFSKNSLILEEFVDDAKIVDIDGCVFQGEILHWQISENLYLKSHPTVVSGGTLPFETTDKDLHTRLWAVYDAVISKAIGKGFDNQFINMEIFVRPNGDIKVVEINPRLVPDYIPFYRMCIGNGDPMVALLNIGSGIKPKPCVWNGKHGLTGFAITFATGKAEDLLDFEEAARHPEVSPVFNHGDDVPDYADGGVNLANVVIVGNNRREVMSRYFDILTKILKKPEFSPKQEYEE
ncbi:uncharacterized protein LOC144448493 [Glandiceps talaboti]